MVKVPSPRSHFFPARMGELFCGLLFAAYAAIILAHREPPLLGDFGDWLYSGEVIGRLLHGVPDAFHSFKRYPVPNTTFTAVLGILCAMVSWQVAGKIYLVLHLAVAFFGMRSLARAAGSGQWMWPVVAGAAFLSLGFWSGLMAFQLGIALLMFYLAGLLKHLDGEVPPGYGLLLLLLFFTHMVPFTFACLLLLLFCWQHKRGRPLLQLILPGIMLIWYGAGRLMTGNIDSAVAPTTDGLFFDRMFLPYKINTILKSFGLVNPTTNDNLYSSAIAVFGSRTFLLLLAINLLVCTAVVLLVMRGVIRPFRQPAGIRFFWIASAIALVAYLIVPPALLGISDPGARILQTVAWTALLLIPSGQTERGLRQTAAAGAILMEATALVLFYVLPWRVPPARQTSIPYAVAVLAKAPYAHCDYYIRGLETQERSMSVFPTALLVNR
jgi:hypothetical protein